MNSFSVAKKTIDAYRVTDENGSEWTLSIESSEKTLDLTVVSHHVSWHHYWGACGCTGYQFLADLLKTKSYLKTKFGVVDILDQKATIDNWISIVLKSRRNGDISSETAREAYDALDEIRDLSIDITFEIRFAVNQLPRKTRELLGDSPELKFFTNPDFEYFWHNVFVPFVSWLRLNNWVLFTKGLPNEPLCRTVRQDDMKLWDDRQGFEWLYVADMNSKQLKKIVRRIRIGARRDVSSVPLCHLLINIRSHYLVPSQANRTLCHFLRKKDMNRHYEIKDRIIKEYDYSSQGPVFCTAYRGNRTYFHDGKYYSYDPIEDLPF